MAKALFLDRDGVINEERGEYTYRIEDFRLTSGIIPFLKAAGNKGYLLIVITNQGGIALGRYSVADLEKVHAYLKSLLAAENIFLTDIFYCPHHSSVSTCLCRKPGTLMLEEAIAKYGINVSESLLVGDSPRDEQAGRNAGIPTLMIPSNADLKKYIDYL
jgi:D-glycero-D-manno-heptose 1,7-bisphosphate phosphatase